MSIANIIFAFSLGIIVTAGFNDMKHGGDFTKGYEQGAYDARAQAIQQETFRKSRLIKYGLCGYAKLACEVPRDRRTAQR